MKQQLRLIGLDCAHCAAKIERAVQELPGVSGASLNFLTGRLTVEGEEQALAELFDHTVRLVRRYEPDAEVRRA